MFKELEQSEAVYERANQLNLAGFQLTILKNYEKGIYERGWQNTYGVPTDDMTGVGIVGGSFNNLTKRYVYIIDIDIYQSEKRDKVFKEIMTFFGSYEVYVETSPSGGYHLIFFCVTKLKSIKNFIFKEKNTSPKHIDHLEFFTNGQVLVAPSMARNKIGKIGIYKRISKVDIFDSAVLSSDEAENLIIDLANLSLKYQSVIYNHNHIISEAYRDELKDTYHKLMSLNFICTPLFSGNRYPIVSNHVQDLDIEMDLTGINVALGKQKDNSYLVCLNYNNVNDQTRAEIMSSASDDLYIEESVSGGFHIMYRTDKIHKLAGKWKLSNDKGTIEILCNDNQTINIAPTCSYIRGYEDEPVYRTSKIISGSIDNIGFIDSVNIVNFVSQLAPDRRKYRGGGGIKEAPNPELINMVLKHIHQYGMVSEIDKQIKLVFPNTMFLLDALDIEHAIIPSENHVRFFSLFADDGNNPDALLYHNKNSNKWSGYSVNDFHSAEIISFSKYLCRHDPQKFDQLMDKIGFGKVKMDVPIETVYSGETIVINTDRYISEDARGQVLDLINKAVQRKTQPRIVITAPTGVGKTEMFYRLAKQQHIRMIMALCYTAQVQQGKEHHSAPGVIEGLCKNDHIVPLTGSIFMTYDKAPIVQKKIKPKNYIMVIDEAHNLVNHINFRNKQIQKLQELSDCCKAVVYMTATPDYINCKDVDLVIKIAPTTPKINTATVVHYKKKLLEAISNVIMSQHQAGMIDVVYIRNSTILDKIKCVINSKSDLETQLLNASVKNENQVYDNLVNHDRLSINDVFKSGGILFTTNLFVDGVNIKDDNIGNIYLANTDSTTDLIQYPARFRNGYMNYYIFSTGVSRKSGYAKSSRQDQVKQIYFRADLQKKSYDKINYLINSTSSITFQPSKGKIQLTDQYELLNDMGNIQKEYILFKVQYAEAMRTRRDLNYLKNYLEGSDYNFVIKEKKVDDLMSDSISPGDVKSALISRDEDIIRNAEKLIHILKCDSVERKELVSDYLKKQYGKFKVLKVMYNHVLTKKYSDIIHDKTYSKLLFNWCTGEEIGAVNSLNLLRLKDSDIDLLQKTLNNLKIEKSGEVSKDDKFLRFIEVRNWVRGLKSGQETVTINSAIIKDFISYFNERYDRLYNPNKIDGVVTDLHVIFDVQKSTKSNKKSYLIRDEWTFDNIRGISFSES